MPTHSNVSPARISPSGFSRRHHMALQNISCALINLNTQGKGFVSQSQILAASLPDLVTRAKRLATTLTLGRHSRRRAGVGETFWQYRPYHQDEPAHTIDWRRSGRDDRLYVRERELESAQQVYVWLDTGSAMRFGSSLVPSSKLERGLLLALAATEALQKSGEKIGIMGHAPPSRAPDLAAKFSAVWWRAALEEQEDALMQASLPPAQILPQRAKALLVSDCLMPIQDLAQRLAVLATKGAKGVLLCVADPLERLFAFTGHTLLEDSPSPSPSPNLSRQTPYRFSKIEAVRQSYLDKRAAHLAELQRLCARHGWQFLCHDTGDAPLPCLIYALSCLSLEGRRFEAGSVLGGLP